MASVESRRNGQAHDPLTSASGQPTTISPDPVIPTIDVSAFLSPSTPSARSKCASLLVAALHRTGIVYLTNHGIPNTTINSTFDLSRSFFALPYDQKMLAPHPASPYWHRGYSGPGLEKITRGEQSVAECKESYEVGSEHDATQPPVWLPESVLPGFREQSTAFYWTLHAFAAQMLEAVALGLGLDEEQTRTWVGEHPGHDCQLRLLHYPPVAAGEVESGKAERMPGHTDWGTFTLLFQDECGGLQAWISPEDGGKGEGEYVDVKPMEGAVVLNVGNMLEHWSNGHLKTCRHRVTLPTLTDRFEGEERMTKERYSMPYFVCPNQDALVQAFPSCVSEQQPAKFEPVKWNDYMKMRAQGSYAED